MPVLFFAYANSEKKPLPLLTEEHEEVYKILVSNYVQSNYHIHIDDRATVSKVNDYLETFSFDIALFNFSGHSGETHFTWGDNLVHKDGILQQIKNSVSSGTLKLVVLNGCSNAGQVKDLRKVGVPVVIATSAPLEDQSAKEFARRFYLNLFEKENTIQAAYEDALGAAQNGTANKLAVVEDFDLENADPAQPLWGIYGEESVRNLNPFLNNGPRSEHKPNPRTILNRLYTVFNAALNPAILRLEMRRKNNELVEEYEKRNAILYSIPFPISINLQKLLNISAGKKDFKNEEEWVKAYVKQIGQLYHTTSEFMGLIMIAQLWEIKLKFKAIVIPDDIKQILVEFFYLPAPRRTIYNYQPMITAIREYMESLPKENDIALFVDEQTVLKDMLLPGYPFADACRYLLKTHIDAQGNKSGRDIFKECEIAEAQLCFFFDELGFLYRYYLTSITHIDVLKYRHLPKEDTHYKHKIVKLMRPLNEELDQTILQYTMPTFLDNWGVVLIKGALPEKNLDLDDIDIEVPSVDFLNLSPFIIDRLVFEEKRDFSSLMFFNQCWINPGKEVYEYNDASCPSKTNDVFQVGSPSERTRKKNELESIRLQFKAFRTQVLGETIS